MATDLISVFFLRTEPFSSRFNYIFRLLDFFFDTHHKAILMLNSFTLVHSRTLAGPQQFLLFCAFLSKQINIMINFYLYVSDNNDSNPSFHEEQLPAIAARRGSWWMFSHASTGSLQVKTFTQKQQQQQQQQQ